MRTVVQATALTLALAGVASTGCKAPPGPSVDAGPTTLPSPSDQATQVLARVGDRTITVGDFTAALEHMDQFDRLRYQAPERRRELLQEMIDVYVLADEARERGGDDDPITRQEIREILRDAILDQVRASAPAPNEIPAEAVRAYFDEHRADFHEPERRRVSAIVVSTEAAASAVLKTLAGEPGPREWADMVHSRSIEPQARAEVPGDFAGDLGFVSPVGDARGANPRVPDEVRASVFDLAKAGDIAARAVRSGDRFYVVKLTSKAEGHERTLEDAERTIRVKLAQDGIRAREDALVDELRKQYPVEIDESALGQVRVDSDAGTESSRP